MIRCGGPNSFLSRRQRNKHCHVVNGNTDSDSDFVLYTGSYSRPHKKKPNARPDFGLREEKRQQVHSPPKHHNRYSNVQKARAMLDFEELYSDGLERPQALLAKAAPRVRNSTLTAQGLANRSMPKYAAAETSLYDAFVVRRKDALPCGSLWMKAEFHRILEQQQPADWQAFVFSQGWLLLFLKRHRLSLRVATHSSHLTVQELLPKIIKYYHYIQHVAATPIPGQVHSVAYGAYDLHRRWNIDQVGLEFDVVELNQTYEHTGAKDDHVAQPRFKVKARE